MKNAGHYFEIQARKMKRRFFGLHKFMWQGTLFIKHLLIYNKLCWWWGSQSKKFRSQISFFLSSFFHCFKWFDQIFLEAYCKYMFFKGWSNIFIHKFLKFWCTDQLFSEVFEAILHCKWKLVYIAFDGLHFLNIRTFFVEKIFFKIFVYSNFQWNINQCILIII